MGRLLFPELDDSEGLILAFGGVDPGVTLLDLDDWRTCVFFDAGPLITPGLRPVCVFGEPWLGGVNCGDDCLLELELLKLNLELLLDDSLVLVLFMVIFIPSRLGLTIYS